MQENQGSIRVKFQATGEEAAVDMPTLNEWISSGRINEEDQIKGNLLTEGEWVAAKDMRIFRLARVMTPTENASPPAVPADQASNPNRYAALNSISIICKMLAVIIMIGAVIMALVFGSELPAASAASMGGLAIVGILLQGAVAAVLLWALAELIPLWIDIEDNTRRAKEDTLAER